ncbi:unnamed protein product [Acanthoscelides obtectus]|uniref:Uncharacterized protein n=1 Tax=Acanthoscelides obtectus TaxID=200917 RepID=A0A9P0LP46_ACAOB|nr:unnamed protein product [Acanthoscelides obtectus]CAK1627570.1 hypothetical protein AOBTE_LOCUS4669 [Acanthoscelides obtectus]
MRKIKEQQKKLKNLSNKNWKFS